MRDKLLKGPFVFLLLVVSMPFAVHVAPFIKSGPLQGYFTDAKDTGLSWVGWMTGDYQKRKSDFCNDHTGFRPDLVRLSGQVGFSLFRKADYGGAVVGAGNNLY